MVSPSMNKYLEQFGLDLVIKQKLKKYHLPCQTVVLFSGWLFLHKKEMCQAPEVDWKEQTPTENT